MLHFFWVGVTVADVTNPPKLLVVADEQGRFGVSILAAGKPLLISPPEGLWSIGTGWDRHVRGNGQRRAGAGQLNVDWSGRGSRPRRRMKA